MKYIVSLLITLVAFSASAQYVTKEAFPSLPPFALPLSIENAKDGSNRLFVAEQKGKIYSFQNSPTVQTRNLYIDLSGIVSQGGGEMGLLGLAFHPNYENNGYFYVNYTTTQGFPRLTSVISRFKVSATNPDSADPASELRLFTLDQPYNNNNGGCLKFGPDGYLYISFGDGGENGNGDDLQYRAQNLDSLHGKILRIDVDGTSGGNNYGIPPSNPFASSTANRKMVYAYGFRNMWHMSFDPVTGKLWAGDVGKGRYEEIDIIEIGKNYGWKILEGNHCYTPLTGCDSSDKVMPVIEYRHLNGDLSVRGGHVYRGSRNSRLYGKYIYGDFRSGRIWKAEATDPTLTNALIIDTVKPNRQLSTFGVDENEELYFASFSTGRLWTIEQLPITKYAPTPHSPENGSIGVATQVTLKWTQIINGVETYEVAISLSPNFESVVKLLTSTFNESATVKLQPATTYYWRVAANYPGEITDWGPTSSFTTGLDAPKLVSPNYDSVNAPTTLQFVWSAVETSTLYDIQIATDRDTTTTIIDTTVSETSATFTLENDKTYFWRVRAKNDSITSKWTGQWQVNVRTFNVPLTDAPIQLEPEKDQVVVIGFPTPNIPRFNWSEVAQATRYEVQVSEDSSFSLLSGTLYTIYTSVQVFSGSVGSYWWRVRACNDGGCGPWSPIWGYSIIHVSVKGESQIHQSISIYPNPTNGSFTISSESEFIRDVRIYDIEGKQLKFTPSMSKFLSHKRAVTLTKPAAGTYFVEVELESGAKVVKKIVVE